MGDYRRLVDPSTGQAAIPAPWATPHRRRDRFCLWWSYRVADRSLAGQLRILCCNTATSRLLLGNRHGPPGLLHSLGLEQYEQAFRNNAIEPDVLPRLTAEVLKEFGVSLIGHRRKLLNAIAALRLANMPASEVARSGAVPSAPSIDAIGERRQVTVLFADLSGSTSWGQQLDAEEVHALLEQFFDRADRAVQAHG
jgi:hypothetical protein